MLADPDGIAVMKSGSLDAKIVHKSSVEAVEVFDYEAATLHIYARMMVGHREVIDGKVVVRCPANTDRPASHRHFLHELFFKHQAEFRHCYLLDLRREFIWSYLLCRAARKT